MLWTCAACTCRYSVGAPCCPQCGSTDREDDMPKSNQAGVSYAGHTDVSPGDVDQPDWRADAPAETEQEQAEPEQAEESAADTRTRARTRKAGEK